MSDAHIHHWQIDRPNGPTSIGRCSCGETREFINSEADARIRTNDWIHSGKPAFNRPLRDKGLPPREQWPTEQNPKLTKGNNTPRGGIGSAHGRSKLTESQVIEIRSRSASGASHQELAEMFGISKHNVSKIVRRLIWTHV